MKNKIIKNLSTEKKLTKLCKVKIALDIIAVASLFFRLWTLFLIALALLVCAKICARIFRAKSDKQADAESQIMEIAAVGGAKSLGEQVSMFVKADYPDAKWVWAQVDTTKRIANGENVFIILNGAGGYRRAKVGIAENNVVALEYQTAPIGKPMPDQMLEENTAENIPIAEQSTNYDLMAYEWVETHINELNERLNEVVGEGISDYLLSAKELPVSESWASICNELKRVGVIDAECVEEGIKIKII